jgi:selenocysteine-specific elongation factor
MKPNGPTPRQNRTQPKERTGTIERIAPDGASAICRGMFKKETDITPFVGAAVTTGRGEAGTIEGRFGASGKFRVAFPPPGLAPAGERGPGDNAVVLRYKKFVYSEKAAAGRIEQ